MRQSAPSARCPARPRPVRAILAVALACCALPERVQAGPEDAFNYFAGISIVHDDNLFRLPANATPPALAAGASRSDLLTTLQAGIRYDRAISLQRVQLDLTGVAYRYRTHDYLNFSALNYRAAWLWAVSPRLTGAVAADRNTVLESYASLQDPGQRNRRTIENQRLTVDAAVDGGWHVDGGLYRLRSRATRANTATGSYTEDTVEAGLRYQSAAGNALALVQRAMQGRYLDRDPDPARLLDTGYEQSETEARLRYQLGARTLLDGRLAYRDRNHDHHAARDYAGAVGTLATHWTPTDKLRLSLSAGRDLVAYQELANSYYATRFVNLAPSWQVTEQTALRVRVGHARNDYRGAIVASAPLREDTVRSVEFGVAWQATRTITVDGHVARELRSSTLPGLPYQDNRIGLAATGTF